MSAAAPEQVRLDVATSGPVAVRAWVGRGGRAFTAVCAPRSASDPAPWYVYEGNEFRGNCDRTKIPASATVVYPEPTGGVDVLDGVYYAVIVDRQPGVGIRNTPLTPRDSERPWVVSLPDSLVGHISLDCLPDSVVEAVRPLADGF